MLLALILGLVAGFVASVPIAGPIAVLVLRAAFEGRRREAAFVALGSGIAEAFYAGVAFAGIGAAVDRFPMLLPISRVVSALVLVVVGVYLILRKPKPAANDGRSSRHGAKLVAGLTITALNPTLVVSWAAVVTALHGAGLVTTNSWGAFPFALGVGAGATGWFVAMAAIVGRFREKISPKVIQRSIQVVGALLSIAGVIIGVRAAILFIA
jgi:threonine/homoserine/homoserine lactone efflux protein